MNAHIPSQYNATLRRSGPFSQIHIPVQWIVVAAIAAALLWSPFTQAGSVTWQNTGTDFNTGGNWSGGIPGTGDNATFSTPKATDPNLSLSGTIQGLTFATTGTGYTLSSSIGTTKLTLTNTGTDVTSAIYAANTTSTNIISAPLVLGGGAATTQTFTQAAGGTLAVSGVISESGAATKLTYAGNGKFTISGSNSYTGNTVIGESAAATTLVNVQNSSAFGTGAGTVSVSAASELDLQGNITIAKALTLNGGGKGNAGALRNISGNNEWSGAITLANVGATRIASDSGNLKLSGNISFGFSAMTLVLLGNGTGEISGVISGTTSMAHSSSGTGTWILSGANTYTGAVSIGNGAFSVSSINSVSTNASLGTVHAATSSLGAPTTIANGTITFGGGNTAGNLIYTGTGETTDRVIFLTANTAGGIIDQSGTGLLKFTSDLTAGAGSKGLTLQGSTAGTGEISGAIVDGSGVTALTKSGTGAWTLSGTSNYTGSTTVSGGKLVVSGSLSGTTSVSVASGAQLNVNGLVNNAATAMALSGTLTGIGTVGAVSATGGTVSPGNGGIGTINTGTLSLTGTAHLAIEIGRTVSGGGALSNDKVNVIGSVTLANGSDLQLSLAQFNPIVGDVLYLVVNDGSDSVSGVFTKLNGVTTTLAEGSQFAFNSVTYQISYAANFGGGSANDIALTAVAIPEPETWAILAAGFGMLIGMQKIRRLAGR